MAQQRLTAVSLFSGCGGFDWGAHQAGVEVIWANDIDPHAGAAYRSLFPDAAFQPGDICDFDTFPEADVLIGCYPCTGFSLGARRRWRGTEERRLSDNKDNFLFREFLRALGQVSPRYLFVENVRGMVSADGGWFLQQQLAGLREYGYRVAWKRLNACDLGVPQSRQRIFIVGVRHDVQNFRYAFPDATHGPGRANRHRVLRDVIGEMPAWPRGEYFDYRFHGHYLTRNRKRAWDELSYTIVANAHHVPLHPMGEPMVYMRKDEWMLQGDANRRLSWRECAAIQGLPTCAVPSGSLFDKYRVVGNAVPPAVGRALLQPVVDFERGVGG